MKRLMRQSLVRCLVMVIITGGILLLLDSASTSLSQASLSGDRSAAICADDWMSLDDPEAALPDERVELAAVGGHPPFIAQPARSVTACSALIHRARAPPVC